MVITRRNFFRTAALAAAAVFIPPLCPGAPKLLARGPLYPFVPAYNEAKRCLTMLPNPAWGEAKYEIRFFIAEGGCGERLVMDPWPVKFHYKEDAQAFLAEVTNRGPLRPTVGWQFDGA